MFNVSLPSNEQWKKVLTAIGFSFVSTFIATLVAQGGFQVGIGWEGVISLLSGAFVASINAVLYTLKITLFDKE